MNRRRTNFKTSDVVRATSLTILLCVSLMLVHSSRVVASNQTQQQPPDKQAAAAANPSDVASMDSTVAALYDVISGPAGKKRDWNRFRSLFIPGARLIPTGKRQSGEISSRVMTADDYATASGKFLEENGFFEKEVARRVESFGNIAHVFSTYESRHKADDAKPFARGINSIQLMNDGKRWWIVTVFWQGEGPDNPLPEKYLSK